MKVQNNINISKGKLMFKFLFSSFLLTLLLSITACNTEKKTILPAFALDTDCKPIIIKSFNKLIETPIFLRVTEAKDKREIMKVNEEYFTRFDDEEWEKLEEDPSNVYKEAVKGIESGDIKITNCKVEGMQTLNGVQTDVISYKRQMEFFAGAVMTSNMIYYIGKEDGLPYMETEKSEINKSPMNSKTTFLYKNIIAPKI